MHYNVQVYNHICTHHRFSQFKTYKILGVIKYIFAKFWQEVQVITNTNITEHFARVKNIIEEAHFFLYHITIEKNYSNAKNVEPSPQ